MSCRLSIILERFSVILKDQIETIFVPKMIIETHFRKCKNTNSLNQYYHLKLCREFHIALT